MDLATVTSGLQNDPLLLSGLYFAVLFLRPGAFLVRPYE
jgi:hypothetical protein